MIPSRMIDFIFFIIIRFLSFKKKNQLFFFSSETFSMNNLRTRFFILSFGDPHGLECGQRRKDRSSDPDGIFSIKLI
jgi:hypothetical protein